MRPKHIEELIDTLCQAPVKPGQRKMSLYIEGPPGGGKTQVCLQSAARNNRFLVGPTENGILHPIMMEPVDLSGVPSVKDGRTYWNPPSWAIHEIPKGFDGTMVLVDEFAQGDQPMQKACASIFEEHRIGNAILPEGTVVVATGNRVQDRAGASKILSHVRRRFAKVTFDSDLDDFERWGQATGKIIPEVIYFLRFKPGCLNNFDPASEQQYASQSGWEKVSSIYPVLSERVVDQTITGLVGAAGNEFLAFAKVWEELANKFNAKEILKDVAKAPLPKPNQLDIMWSLVGSIAEHVKDKPAAVINEAVKYFNRMSQEFAYVGCRHILRSVGKGRYADVFSAPEYAKFLEKNKELLVEASGFK